jgi:hypothetical protein
MNELLKNVVINFIHIHTFVKRTSITQGLPFILTEPFCYLWQEVDMFNLSCDFDSLKANIFAELQPFKRHKSLLSTAFNINRLTIHHMLQLPSKLK